MKKLLTGLGAAIVLVLGLAGPAAAHVTPTPNEVPAGGYAAITFRIGHGCEGEGGDTDKVEIQMPDGVESATPQAIPGWEATVDDSGPVVVTFEGGPLSTHEYLEFGVSLQLPDTPGETAFFPVIQTCESGEEIAWIEETVEGEEEPEEPAPAVAITEATGDHHGGGAEDEEAEAGDEHADGEAAATDAASSEDDGTDSLAVVALIVGALGLMAGAYAILVSRRAS
jgi:uncharacterized protein YcnI